VAPVEQVGVVADPVDQATDALGRRDSGLPAEPAFGLADVGHEDALVARAPVVVGGVE
jgi:hypothetical protein